MKKNGKKEFHASLFAGSELQFEATLENFKRRRALSPLSPIDMRSRLFFERILQVKKIRDLVFCGRAR
ncbi:MAG: hypothetical protein A3C47_07075 [Omnitrophica bacterium RIFCSPHIGHO2_02_FULL_51_18]|nr:MAG: hypothetical protein A3C47_07075 [Omnitrophica bacterium RIFCSPHIGHO2_02_FULL_51_18]